MTEEQRLKRLEVMEQLAPYVCKNCDHLKSKHKDGMCPGKLVSMFDGGQVPKLSVELWGVILGVPLE